MKPQLVSQILDNQRVVEEFEPEVLRESICSKETIDIMKSCLEGVMVNGTGKRLESTFFKIAGKTGTAQIANRNEGYGEEGEKKYIASFAGYFPADDPIYSCIVVIAAPTDDIYGASVSGTVFSAIANKVYASSYEYHKAVNEKSQIATIPFVQNGNRYDVNQALNTLNIQKDIKGSQPWIYTSQNSKSIALKDFNFNKKQVPHVVGMGLEDALYLIEQTGMRARVKGYGTVVKQSVSPGQQAVVGGVIKLELEQR
jgi:cell division protein FtsI (penicillin-binding protein 3)